jgi:methionyl-tRNA formyltransferase
MHYSPVKQYALEQDLPLLQPEKLKDETFIKALRHWDADLQIVVAFRMLPEVVWNMPRLGTFNLHASLLPQYRGAAPIHWAVINGETETGVTTFFLQHEIDTGKIIQQARIPIAEGDNIGIVHDKLMMLGGRLVIETVNSIINGTANTISQEKISVTGELHPAPKIDKKICRINWNQPVKRVYDFIRGLSPYPTAWTELQISENEIITVKIFESEKIIHPHQLPPGTIETDGKRYMNVAVSNGFVAIRLLQLPGKKPLQTADLLRGFQLTKDSKMINP